MDDVWHAGLASLRQAILGMPVLLYSSSGRIFWYVASALERPIC